MRTALLTLAALVSIPAAPASAGYWDDLECAWRQELPGIRASTCRSEALLSLRCDSQLTAATLDRFARIDAESLAAYNRGVFAPAFSPRGAAAGAVVNTASKARSAGRR